MRINRKNALKYSVGFITKTNAGTLQNRSEIAQKEISEIAAELEQSQLEILSETQAELDAAQVLEIVQELPEND